MVACMARRPWPSPMNISASRREVLTKSFFPEEVSYVVNSAQPLPPWPRDDVTSPKSRLRSIHSAIGPDAAADAATSRRADGAGNAAERDATRDGATRLDDDEKPPTRRGALDARDGVADDPGTTEDDVGATDIVTFGETSR